MKYVIKSNIGVVRSENQDKAAVFFNKNYYLAILCDGMGGHQGGSYASLISISTFEKEFKKKWPKNPEKIDEWFSNAIKKTHEEMKKFSQKNISFLDMGTTLTLAIVSKEFIKVYNIGDSRTYIYNGVIHQITKDHNLRNYYISKYNYSEEKAATIMGAAALTNALGPNKKIKIDSFLIKFDENIKYVILTSDGIHDYINKDIFEKIISSKKIDLEKKAENLIKQAIKNKSSDNLTNIILEVE